MVRPQALMESVSANLHEFLHSIDADLTQPQKKFLRDGLVGLLRAGRPVVCRMARKLPDQRTKFLSRLDRMEANLNRESDFDDKLKTALPDLWLPMVCDETPIILDLSDIAKPLAKKMDYLATVRDGSTISGDTIRYRGISGDTILFSRLRRPAGRAEGAGDCDLRPWGHCGNVVPRGRLVLIGRIRVPTEAAHHMTFRDSPRFPQGRTPYRFSSMCPSLSFFV